MAASRRCIVSSVANVLSLHGIEGPHKADAVPGRRRRLTGGSEKAGRQRAARCDKFSTTGKPQIRLLRTPVKSLQKKYSAFQNTQISGICSSIPPGKGTDRDRHETCGGLRWTRARCRRLALPCV